MKKLSIISMFFALLLVVSSCKKDEKNTGTDNPGGNQLTVEKKQRSMFIDFTATWCGPCGGWGIPTFKQTVAQAGDNVVPFAVHAAPPQTSELVGYYKKPGNDTVFVSPVLGDFLTSINGLNLTGWPTLWINDAAMSTDISQNVSKINAKAAEEPVANMALEVTRTGNGFTLRAATKFFKSTTGDYYMTVLVTEDNIANRQNVNTAYDNSFIHQHITRGTAINSSNADRPATFGDAPIASGSIEANTYIEKTYSFTHAEANNLPSGINKWVWKPNDSHVVAVLWKKNANGKYDFVNATQVKL